eukprot:213175-Chlamydomonas_euryale.AAC.3
MSCVIFPRGWRGPALFSLEDGWVLRYFPSRVAGPALFSLEGGRACVIFPRGWPKPGSPALTALTSLVCACARASRSPTHRSSAGETSARTPSAWQWWDSFLCAGGGGGGGDGAVGSG